MIVLVIFIVMVVIIMVVILVIMVMIFVVMIFVVMILDSIAVMIMVMFGLHGLEFFRVHETGVVRLAPARSQTEYDQCHQSFAHDLPPKRNSSRRLLMPAKQFLYVFHRQLHPGGPTVIALA